MHPLEKFEYCPRCGSKHFDVNSEKSRQCENCGFEYYMNPSAATAAFILNERGELLVERRGKEPAKGTLDLPGGFTDLGETAEEGVAREVMEETGLEVCSAEYLFSIPNVYRYSGMDIPTLDFFFRCEVKDCGVLPTMPPSAFGCRSRISIQSSSGCAPSVRPSTTSWSGPERQRRKCGNQPRICMIVQFYPITC